MTNLIEFKRQITVCKCKWWQFEGVSLEIRINFTYGHWYRPWHGLWTSVGVFLSERITSKDLARDKVELLAEGESRRS